MAKNIRITVGGVVRTFTGSVLRTSLVGGGYCNWVPQDEAGGAQLNAPTISLSNDILTITNGNNGTFSEYYELRLDGTTVDTLNISTTSITVSQYITSSGTITVTVGGTGMITSVPSNSVSYTPPPQSNFLLSNGDILETSDHKTFNVNE